VKMKVRIVNKMVFLAWLIAFIAGFLLAPIFNPLLLILLVLTVFFVAVPLDIKLNHATKNRLFPSNLKDSIITNLIEVSFIALGYLGGRLII